MPLDPVPTDLLQCHDASIVSKYLRYFVLEARTQDGKKYPPTTTRSLLSGLNRILKELKAPFSILDKSNPAFHKLLLTFNIVASDLHREEVSVSKESASVIPSAVFWPHWLHFQLLPVLITVAHCRS